jgi:signal transduction histidine kinase
MASVSRHHEGRPTPVAELGLPTGVGDRAVAAIEARLQHEGRTLARREEPGWIAQDLHDGVIQSIYATGLGLQECLRLLDEDPRKARRKLAEAIDRLNIVICDVRSYLAGLQPEGLRVQGLSGALRELARGLERNARLVAELEVEPGVDAILGPEEARHLFHVCREALTNVVKHARGSRVQLTLGRSNDVVRLSVKDDGVGFDRLHDPASGRGLRNIGDRVRHLRGTLSVDSAPGQGTRIVVDLPLRGGRERPADLPAHGGRV